MEDGLYAHVFAGTDQPSRSFRVPFSAPPLAYVQTIDDDSKKREFIDVLSGCARKAIFEYIAPPKPPLDCHCCGQEGAAVFVLSSYRLMPGSERWVPLTYAAVHCGDPECLEVVRKRLSACVDPGENVGRDLGVRPGCIFCGVQEHCIELPFRSERVCHDCRRKVCHFCGKRSGTEPFRTCGKCHVQAYCGVICQRHDWERDHRARCDGGK